MVESSELHPVASESLQKSAEFGYFLPKRMVTVFANRDPARCVRWAYELVAPEIKRVTLIEDVSQTLAAVESALDDPVASRLSTLDKLAWDSWICGFDYDSAPFYAHRAASRLAWATMGLVVFTNDSKYECQYLGGPIAGRDAGLGMVVSECTSALAMSFSNSDDGRLMVAHSFSMLMEHLA